MSDTTKKMLLCALFPLWCTLAEQIFSLLIKALEPVYAAAPGANAVLELFVYSARHFVILLYVVATPGLFAPDTPRYDRSGLQLPPASTRLRLPPARHVLAALLAGVLLFVVSGLLDALLARISGSIPWPASLGEYAPRFYTILAGQLLMLALYPLTIWLLVRISLGGILAPAGTGSETVGVLFRVLACAVLALVFVKTVYLYLTMAAGESARWFYTPLGAASLYALRILPCGCFAGYTFLLWRGGAPAVSEASESL